MPDQETTPKLVRAYVAITLLAVLLWQFYLCITAAFKINTFKVLLRELGVELPVPTKLLFQTHGFFWLLPVLGLFLFLDVVRRRRIPTPYAGAAFAALVLISMLMQILLFEGLFTPLKDMIDAIK